MKTILLAALATALCSAPALAGDPTATDWSGFYLGANGGYSLGHFNVVIPPINYPPVNFSANGGLIGATAGFNVQNGNIVFGVEGDADWSGMAGDSPGIKPNNSPASVLTAHVTWLSTLRARVGVSSGNLLFFATAGLAAGGLTGHITNYPSGSLTTSIAGTQYGYALGGGVEAALTDNISIKAEYLHADLGTKRYDLPPYYADAHASADMIRFGINYRF